MLRRTNLSKPLDAERPTLLKIALFYIILHLFYILQSILYYIKFILKIFQYHLV